ncbi:hypothetical protein ACWCPQ_20290 [Nocardia sp. NPDC001965]
MSTAYPAVATYGDVSGGCAIDGGAGVVDVGGLVVFGAVVVVDPGDVVVGDVGVVGTSGDVDVVVELTGIGVVVVVVGTVVLVAVLVGTVVVVGVVVVGTVVVAGADVTVIVDGSVGTVAVLGSAVTGTVGVSVGVTVTVTVDIEVEVTAPGSGTPAVAWIERLTVAEKLALTDASVEFPAGASGAVAVVDSVAVVVPVPGSVDSGGGWAVPGSVAVSGTVMSSGTETSLGALDVVLGVVTLVRRWSKACMGHSPESFVRTGGPEPTSTMSVVPIAVVTNAATTPARDIGRRNRSVDGPAACRPHRRGIRGRGPASRSGFVTRSSLLSPVCIQLLLSPRCVPTAGNR